MKTKSLSLFILFLGAMLSVGLQAQIKVIERPAFEAWNTTTLEIDKIERCDTATILFVDAYYRAKQWITINKDTYIRESGKSQKLLVKSAEGIDLGEKFTMPESGKASFKLTFPPLDKSITKIDFIEGDCVDCFKTWGIYLNGQKPKPVQIPLEATASVPVSKTLPQIQLKSGTAIFSASISGNFPEELRNRPALITVSNLITGEKVEYQIELQKDGSFRKEIPVISPCFALIESAFYVGYMYLEPNKENKLFVDFQHKSKQESRYQRDETDKKPSVYMNNSLGLTAANLEYIFNKPYELFDRRALFNEIDGMNPEAYKSHLMKKMNEGIQLIQANKDISENAKQLTINNLKLTALQQLFTYEQNAKIAYVYKNNLKPKSLDEVGFTPEKPTATYYSVLKDFKLNDPNYLYFGSFGYAVNGIRNLSTYNIPKEKASMTEWLANAKQVLKDDIGFDQGVFYDLMAAQEYSKQMGEMQPLTDAQKAELKTVFTNPTIVSQLLAENDKVLKLQAEIASQGDFVINETPAVENEKVLDAILAEYKGKVVFFDFWATWCGPCRKAMKEAEPVKESFKGKDVVFVYLTGETSPMKKWQEMVPGITGEHYRVSNAQWNYLNENLGIEGIPSYFIYDKNGVQKQKSIGFMGVDKMQEWISESL